MLKEMYYTRGGPFGMMHGAHHFRFLFFSLPLVMMAGMTEMLELFVGCLDLVQMVQLP